MKSIFLSVSIFFFSIISFAQAPQAFNYQGIARDGSGSPLANTAISLRITLLEGAPPGMEVFKESHHVQTSMLGLFTVEVGRGSSQSAPFENINWGSGDHYIQIEMDPSGGTNYTLLGKSQLLSVPYALFAGNGAGGNSPWQRNEKGIHYDEGFVGIGTPKPDYKLSIEGDNPTGDARTYLNLHNLSASNRSYVSLDLKAGSSNAFTTLQHISDTYDYEGDKFKGFGQLESSGRGVIIRASKTDGLIKFLAGGNSLSPVERMRITGNGLVGIGTETPDAKLSIEGDNPTGDARTFLKLHNLSASNRSYVSLDLKAGASNTSTTLQHIGETYDYEGDKFTGFGQLESSGQGVIIRASRTDGMIKFLAGGNTLSPAERMRITGKGFVGIGTENPQQKLTIEGNDNEGADVDYLFLNNTSRGNRSGVLMALSAGDHRTQTTIGHHAETYDFDFDKFNDFGQVHSSGAGLILRASGTHGVIKFLMGLDEIGSSTERMRLTNDGNLGVGTETPVARIQVADGDIYIEDINNGVIMKSPNGSCWRMTMNNDGTFRSTSIPCPN